MCDLALNPRGVQFARNQARLAEFFTLLAAGQGVQCEIAQDRYVAPMLLTTDVLAKLCEIVRAEHQPSQLAPQFEVFMQQVSPEQAQQFQERSNDLGRAAQQIDSSCGQAPDFEHYDVYVTWLARVVEALQQIDGVPQVDFNADKYVLTYAPSEQEVKLVINLLGTSVIDIADNNKQLDKDPNAFSNNLWAVYLIVGLSTFAFQIVVKNLQYYAQFIGATASQTTNLTTFFNLTQLFFSVFWLWLSDIIGRKPVFLITLGIYVITTGVLTIVPDKSNSQQIPIMQGLRAAMGVGAIIAPIGFVIGADLAPPKNRGVVTVWINISTQVGSILASAITIFFGSGKPYETKNLITGSTEYNLKNIKSYVDSHFTAMGIFIASMLLAVVILKESHPRIIAMRKLKKMGISNVNNERVKAEPAWRVFLQMCRNRDILLLFFAYWINLIGATNTRTGGQVFITKMYGFTDTNYAKSYANTAQIVSIVIGVVFSMVFTKPLIRTLGEVRVIIMSQFVSFLESVIHFAVNMPLPPWLMYISLSLASITLIFCDAIFLQLVSMYTTPQNRGQVLGIFQIGNSIGRTLSGVLTGVMYDYNIRDAQMFNTLFASVCLLLLALVRPPLQRTEMDAAARKMKEQQQIDNRI